MLVALQWLLRFVVPALVPSATPIGVLVSLACGLGVIVWWLCFSRACWRERVGVIALMAIAIGVTRRLVHPSIAGGMMGFMLPVYAVPVLCLALVAWAAGTRNVSSGLRRASLVAAVLLACGMWTLVRTGGFTSDLNHDWAWRWSPTREDRLLAEGREKEPAVRTVTIPMDASAAPGSAHWPGFRGAARDNVLRGARIATDWTSSPPMQLWRKPVGPGWSSFAVNGDLIYTQEQRGEEEVVACYRLGTGEPVWRHQDATRFW
ncbi:MAG TPA: hypothetical protein VM029_05025 [Opitutaceae bacterium]|nr:hypothetical protein [Opitutaceae bacterium]